MANGALTYIAKHEKALEAHICQDAQGKGRYWLEDFGPSKHVRFDKEY